MGTLRGTSGGISRTLEVMMDDRELAALRAECERLRARLNSWCTRGRDLCLHDPEMKDSMQAMKDELRDPAKARAALAALDADMNFDDDAMSEPKPAASAPASPSTDP